MEVTAQRQALWEDYAENPLCWTEGSALLTGHQLMRCVGMARWQIVGYFLSLFLLLILCFKLVRRTIPDTVWTGRKVCTRWETRARRRQGRVGERTIRRCTSYREGSREECAAKGKVAEIVIASVCTLVVTMLAHRLVVFALKARVYRPHAVVGEMALRAIVDEERGSARSAQP